MILLDIDNLKNIVEQKTYSIRFINNNLPQEGNACYSILGIPSISQSTVAFRDIHFVEKIGMGSYGSVYRISISGNSYAFKISHNEIPEKLQALHHQLKQHLRQNVINIFCSGKLIGFDAKHVQINKNDNSDAPLDTSATKNIYYSIMEFGGTRLDKYNISSAHTYKTILSQIVNIVKIAQQNRLLIQDLKIENLTINSSHVVKLIDIYLYCESYSPCQSCHVVRTYSALEMDKEKYKSRDTKNIYENPQYNFSGIYIPLMVLLINITCRHGINGTCERLMRAYDVELRTKFVVQLLQIACYNFMYEDNKQLKHKYSKLYKHKKKMEEEYEFIVDGRFFEYFTTLLDVKHEFRKIISSKLLALIAVDLLNLMPDKRKLTRLENLVDDGLL
jgi:serine/threonine protein kinase